MEDLRLLFVFVLTVATVTGLQNGVQYEMEEMYGSEPDAVGSWWRQRVTMIIVTLYMYTFLMRQGLFSNAISRFYTPPHFSVGVLCYTFRCLSVRPSVLTISDR